ncbi:hypothetical protein ADG881_3154 [Alcanivorax sp. DG881]|nr:hypothetical protein ADG881_3154 [Alcanivorax sp. DG881]
MRIILIFLKGDGQNLPTFARFSSTIGRITTDKQAVSGEPCSQNA